MPFTAEQTSFFAEPFVSWLVMTRGGARRLDVLHVPLRPAGQHGGRIAGSIPRF